MKRISILLFAIAIQSSPASAAEQELTAKERRGIEYFENHVRPLLATHCYECHSEASGKRSGGLLLDRQSGWLDGGDLGQAVVPGDVGGSLLIQAIRYQDDLQMPPDESLSPEAIAIFEQWVRIGAPGPIQDLGETEFSKLGDQDLIFTAAEKHWAFQPLQVVPPPQVSAPEWNRHPIDRFVFQKLQEHHLTPSQRAPQNILMRRIAFDLTGLPPESGERPRSDNVADEIEHRKQIDKLIESPHFGEHFARLWLDVVRYADTANVTVPATRPSVPSYYPYAFTYRDYVVVSFNSDKPYDQFIKEQLAVDLMGVEPRAPEQAALGIFGVTPFLANPHDFADDVIDTVSRGFLGLTVACARCHDHKFEPIPTADYYSWHGIFSSVTKPDPDDFDEYPLIDGYQSSAAEQADFAEQKAKIEEKIAAAKESGRLVGARRPLSEVIKQSELTELMTFHPGAPVRAIVVHEASKPVTSQIFLRGEPDTRGDFVPRRFLKVLDPKQTPFPKENSGRLALAQYIASADNPLTARVFVNRVWGALMGRFLVDTPSDFGLQGVPPTHPELLDWLAWDFIDNGWSVKHLVRRILTSQTYQQHSQVRSDVSELDPTNQWYHRAEVKRLSIEEIRDAMLATSGDLDRSLGGRAQMLWGEGYTLRRSVYGLINRINMDPTLRAFDFPSPTASADRRSENIVPQQSLFALNSQFVIDQSRRLAERLGAEREASPTPTIEALFQQVLRRSGAPAELKRATRFVELMQQRNTDPYPLIAQSLLISNEFLYVD
jgi:hypothetical protein